MPNIYFDFHSPELYAIHTEGNWSRWFAKLVQLQFSGTESYFSAKISRSSNLVIPTNMDTWEYLQEEWSGKVVDRSLIAYIITEWNKLYQQSQKPEVKSICHPDDMIAAGQIKILLKKYKGSHLVIRVE